MYDRLVFLIRIKVISMPFNHEFMLNLRNKITDIQLPIFYLEDNDGEKLKLFLDFMIQFQQESGIEDDYRVACILNVFGHMTPLMIEKHAVNLDDESIESLTDDDTDDVQGHDDFVVRIYCTDSRALDIQHGQELRSLLLEIPEVFPQIELYAVGLDPSLNQEQKQTIRQHSDGVCGVYSLLDLELMLRVSDLYDYLNFKQGMVRLASVDQIPLENARTFQITNLPPAMMLYTQSIFGDEKTLRVGLTQYINTHPESASVEFTLLSPSMTFADLYSAEGYNFILSSLSCEQYSARFKHRWLDETYCELHHLLEGKTITLQELCQWHERQFSHGSKQRALMIDMLIAVFHEINKNHEKQHESFTGLLQEYDLTQLRNEDHWLNYIEKYVEFQQAFNGLRDQNAASIRDPLRELDAASDLVKKTRQVSPLSIFTEEELTLFAVEIFSRTPERHKTPIFGAQGNSPILMDTSKPSPLMSAQAHPVNLSFSILPALFQARSPEQREDVRASHALQATSTRSLFGWYGDGPIQSTFEDRPESPTL